MSHKTCIICNTSKPFEEYYKHPQMSFGVDSKCKDCVKARAKTRHHNLSDNDPDFISKERERHKEKYHRLGYKELQKDWDKDKPWKATSVYKGLRGKYKDLDRNYELHHWNYNDEYLTDVFILNIKDHKNLHNDLTLDLEKRVFHLADGTYLDTKEKHESYIKDLKIEIHNQVITN